MYQQRDIFQVDRPTDQLSYPAIYLTPFQTKNTFCGLVKVAGEMESQVLKTGNVGSVLWQPGSCAGLKEVQPQLWGRRQKKISVGEEPEIREEGYISVQSGKQKFGGISPSQGHLIALAK